MSKAITFFLALFFQFGCFTVANAYDPFSDELVQEQNTDKNLNRYGEKKASPDQAIEFYDYCMAKRYEHMCTEAQNNYCQCASVKIREEMSYSDMGSYDPELLKRNTSTLLFVQRVAMACMGEPLYQKGFNYCLSKNELKGDYSQNRLKICECTGEKVKSFAKDGGAGALTATLMSTEHDKRDAFRKLFGTIEYRTLLRNSVNQCAKSIGRNKI